MLLLTVSLLVAAAAAVEAALSGRPFLPISGPLLDHVLYHVVGRNSRRDPAGECKDLHLSSSTVRAQHIFPQTYTTVVYALKTTPRECRKGAGL